MKTAALEPNIRRDSRDIVPPAEFPVVWEAVDDAKMFWERDMMHYPAPMKPAEFALMKLYENGFNTAADLYDLPVRMRTLRINTYYYQSIFPIGLPPEGVLKVINGIGRVFPGLPASIQKKAVGAQAKKYEATLQPAVYRLAERWEKEWLPEIKEHLAFWSGFDLPGATNAGLIAHLDESVRRADRVGAVHFFLGIPQLLSMSQYLDAYHDLFPNDHRLDAFRLLQGFPNKTLETNREMWRLSLLVLDRPAVRDAIVNAPGLTMAALEAIPEAAEFLAALRTYLEEYGQRGDRFATIGEVSWIEDPTPVLKNLRDYLVNPLPDPEREREAHERAREAAVASVRSRLAGYPAPVVQGFERALKAAQEGTVLHEDHGFWIDYRCLYRMRRVLLEFGRRFAASGVCDRDDDAFLLTIEEIRETTEVLPAIDRRELVAARRAEIARFGAMKTPPALGRRPLMPPPEGDPLARTIARFWGNEKLDDGDAATLTGIGGSTGAYTGTARVIKDLADAGRLAPGEILVTGTTAAPWTPLFASAGAVVTDTGGVLSHCAVVAREYAIPAVVGTRNATERIADGARIEVDGNTGRVRLL